MKTQPVDEAELSDADEPGTRWAFMKPKIIGDGRTVYMLRLTLLATPLFGIQLHWIYRPDNQRELHDHPWSFLSILLRGWYAEDVPADGECRQTKRVNRRWFNWKRAEGRHSIRYVSRSPVWTLVFRGRIRRKWGFWVPALSKCVCDPDVPRSIYAPPHDVDCPAYYHPHPDDLIFVEYDKYEKLNDA